MPASHVGLNVKDIKATEDGKLSERLPSRRVSKSRERKERASYLGESDGARTVLKYTTPTTALSFILIEY